MFKKLIERLLEKWLAKPLEKLARKLEKIDAQGEEADTSAQPTEGGESPAPAADTPSAPPTPSALPWAKCKYASCWDGANASKRFMNMLSPRFSDKKFGEYLAWTIGKGCDHCHLILLNEGDGEGAGYDCCTDAKANAVALERIKAIRAKDLGVVLWIVTDDSPNYRAKLFANPAKYAKGAANLLPYASAVVIGLEMNEGGTTSAQWKAVRDAFKKYADVPFGTHHTSGNEFKFGSLGDFICGQLDPGCSTADIKKQIAAIKAKGKDAVGFEYSRNPDKARAQAALDAGAHAVGNWDGKATTKEDSAVALAQSSPEDAVDYSQLSWSYGGFKGGSAKLDSKARIYNLQVKADSMSYKWLSGGCENLGASSKDDYSQTLACLFCLIGGKWVGGKFDWVSTSRLTRDFKNIKESYNGWPKDAIGMASKYAFVICSSDGKHRTNVALCAK